MRGQEVALLSFALACAPGCGAAPDPAAREAPVEITIGGVDRAEVRERPPRAVDRPPIEAPTIQYEPWNEDVRRRAAASGRPLLVLVCAWWLVACSHLERDVMTSVAVRLAAEPFVVAKLDLSGATSVDDDARRAIGVEHVPALVLIAPGGSRVERWRREELEVDTIAAALEEFAAR